MLGAAALALVVMAIPGCGGAKSEAPAAVAPVVDPKPQLAAQDAPKEPEKPKPETVWADLMKKGEELLAADKLDELETHFAEFDKVYTGEQKPPVEQTAALDELKQRRTLKIEERDDRFREEKLASAREFLNAGKYEEATAAVNEVQKLAPSSAQREEASSIISDVERRRAARSRLSTWMKMLSSPDKKESGQAYGQLKKDPDVSLPLLIEAAQSDNPVLTANALDVLQRFKRPEKTLPVMLGVLSREAQEKNWPDAVREISRAAAPGIGTQLLELTLSSKNPAQRSAALAALARVPDPPDDAFLRLLPRVYEDGVDLAAALNACSQAVRTHRQYDLLARRGLDVELTEDQERMLTELPARLDKLLEQGTNVPDDVVEGAKILAMTTRQKSPQPLEGIKVNSYGGQTEDGKAAAVLDGVWNKIEAPTMWRHPIDRKGQIILDLGEERIVEGIRIWNFNEPSGMHRGWKEVEVFVSATETALNPVASGIVLPAPGLADTPDYSSVIPVPSVRGRYVRLEAKSVWRPDTYMGLSEIQVLGY
ncbi:MAG: discoidin domain-containing protein [Planctomycetaceae bacterium]|nr:discoidin domain-containing protein [Planctomycetaceae bacterium]